MRVDASKAAYYVCSITVFSDAVKLFSRPPLTFEPGRAAFKLLTAIRGKVSEKEREQLSAYINSLVAPRNDFRTISDCCCLAGFVHTQQDSFRFCVKKGRSSNDELVQKHSSRVT
jgi:hypothetical protein